MFMVPAMAMTITGPLHSKAVATQGPPAREVTVGVAAYGPLTSAATLKVGLPPVETVTETWAGIWEGAEMVMVGAVV